MVLLSESLLIKKVTPQKDDKQLLPKANDFSKQFTHPLDIEESKNDLS
jgi:hypothetical protein